MPTTIRDWMLVKGMTYAESVMEVCRARLAHEDGNGLAPSSLIVRVQNPGDRAYTQYAYECHTVERALFILEETYGSAGDGTLIRVEWNPPHYGWCDACGEPLDATGACEWVRSNP